MGVFGLKEPILVNEKNNNELDIFSSDVEIKDGDITYNTPLQFYYSLFYKESKHKLNISEINNHKNLYVYIKKNKFTVPFSKELEPIMLLFTLYNIVINSENVKEKINIWWWSNFKYSNKISTIDNELYSKILYLLYSILLNAKSVNYLVCSFLDDKGNDLLSNEYLNKNSKLSKDLMVGLRVPYDILRYIEDVNNIHRLKIYIVQPIYVIKDKLLDNYYSVVLYKHSSICEVINQGEVK